MSIDEINDKNETLAKIAAQLSCPDGEEGIAMGEMMDETNIGMTLATLDNLSLGQVNSVLEIGHGNAGHLKLLFDRSNDLHYTGIEISETMSLQAKQINKDFITKQKAEFVLYNGGNVLPFDDGIFDRVFTVNTLYFWEAPLAFITDIFRVLRPGGSLLLTFAHKDFMEKLPFVKFGFRLYNPNDIADLLKSTDFSIAEAKEHAEEVKSKTGELVVRQFSVLTIRRKV